MAKIDVNTQIKTANRRAILRLIRQSGSISRVQLAQKLRISKSTVTENIAPLLAGGVVLETGVGASQVTGGRRPVLLRINGAHSYMVAAELGLQEPIFALADLNGRLLLRRTVSLPDSAPYAVRLRITKEAIRQLVREGNVPAKALSVIALSSPGAYSAQEKGFVLNPEVKDWDVDRLTRDLTETFNTEVFRVNDVNAATVGEFYQGAGRNYKSILFLSCGVGVGMGLVLDGKLYTGANGSAGEIARAKLNFGGKPLRTQVEITALLERIRAEAPEATIAALGRNLQDITFRNVVDLWGAGDAFVHRCIGEIAETLGAAVAFVTSVLNCEMVVFGGDYLVFENQMLPIMNTILQRDAFDPVPAVPSVLRQDAGLQGLLSMAADAMLDAIASKRNG